MTMTSEKDIQHLGRPLRDVKKEFDQSVIPHRPALWQYCQYLTGSPWDAEDLVQETLIKAFSSLAQVWQPINPKSYLFKIASNTWIDECRKVKVKIDSIETTEEPVFHDKDIFEIEDAIERLVLNLPPRQRVTLLLKEVFQFKAKEIAQIIGCSEGSIKALLNRARNKITRINEETNDSSLKPRLTEEHKKIINAYIESFNRKDPDGIAKLLDENVNKDIVHIAQESGKDVVRNNSLEDWSKDPVEMSAELHFLWGRPTIVQIAQHQSKDAVYDLNLLEIEDGKIIKARDFYFCPELLKEAAKELNIGVFPRNYTL